MSALSFSVVGARAEPFAVAPQLTLRLRLVESTGADVYAIALRAQIMLEPQKRRYDPDESERLVALFGTRDRYGETLRPMLWTHATQMVLAFRDATEFELTVPCSYDFEVAAHQYLAALRDGEIPLALFFSGTTIERGESRPSSGFVPWTCEATYRLPVAVWRETMDAHFPGAAWLRVSSETFDDLRRFRASRHLPTWDATVARLLAGEAVRS